MEDLTSRGIELKTPGFPNGSIIQINWNEIAKVHNWVKLTTNDGRPNNYDSEF